ncbi:MAG: MoaD/ThiS family protein [Bacteriovoracaceae bacterium]
MFIVVKYFSIIREKIEKAEETLHIPEHSTTTELWNLLKEKYSLHEHEEYLRFAVNMDYVDHPFALKEGDVVALITPVAGG